MFTFMGFRAFPILAGRGERNGWTGDAAFASESEMFDFDTGAFFTQYLVLPLHAHPLLEKLFSLRS